MGVERHRPAPFVARSARPATAFSRTSEAPTPSAILRLQRSAGNRATARLLREVDVHGAAAPAGVQRKSAAVIARRRACKVSTVEALTRMAVAGHAGFRLLDVVEATDVAAELTAHYTTLNDEDFNTLRTAKGCVRAPAGVINRDAPLLTFFRSHFGQGCGQSFAADAALWAAQIVQANPRNAALQAAWAGQQGRIDAARQAAANDIGRWYAAPGMREPRNGDEALYYVVWSAQSPNADQGAWQEYVRDHWHEQFPDKGIRSLTFRRAGEMDLARMRP